MSISSTSNTLSSPSSGSGSCSATSTPQPGSLRATPSTSSNSSAPSPLLADQLLGGDPDDDDNIFRTKVAVKVLVKVKEEKLSEPDERVAKDEPPPRPLSSGPKTSITTTIDSNHIDKKRSDKPNETQTKQHQATTDSCHTERITTTTTSTTTTSSPSSSLSSTTTTTSQRPTVLSTVKRPAVETVTTSSMSTTYTPTILKKTAPYIQTKAAAAAVALSSSSSFKNVAVSNNSAKGPQASQQSTANRWRLGTKLETTCNILSKSSKSSAAAAAASSSSSSRPDLVAASSSSSSSPSASSHSLPPTTATTTGAATPTTHINQQQSQVINFKTLPLLMHHNHHIQTTSLVATGGNNSSKNGGSTSSSSSSSSSGATTTSSSAKPLSATAAPARALVSTLTPQIILSQFITAAPVTQRSHSTLTSASLEGLQFCLTSASTTGTQAGNNQVLQVQTLTHAPTRQSQSQPASSSGTTTTTSTTTTSSPSKQARDSGTGSQETKSKVKSSQNSQTNSASNNSKNVDSPSPSAQHQQQQGDDGSPGNNVAAARLLDLGKKLLEATREGKLDQVRHLVEDSGAPFTSDWLGTTALHLAAQGCHQHIAEVLVRAGVNRDARTKLERTALHLAAQSGSLEIVDLLLTHGSDVNARDMLRMTPLHWAVERGHVYVAERLLISGADAELANKFLLTPVDIARELGSYEMIELFKNWTGDTIKDDQNLEAYGNCNPEAALNESQDFLDIDYHLALVDSATNSRATASTPLDDLDKTNANYGSGGSGVGGDDSGGPNACIDLVEFEWNKFDFDPDLFLPSESNEEEQKVDFLMKVVEDLKKENQLLRQKVEKLSTVDE